MDFENIDMGDFRAPVNDDTFHAGEKPAKMNRKKFAVPPVKLACLGCRASRTRCDGKSECTSCTIKGKTCVYTESKRGGSRIRKRRGSSSTIDSKSTPFPDNSAFNHASLSILPELNQADFADQLSLVMPGGGLKQLDLCLDDTDFMFDAIFNTQLDAQDSGYDTTDHTGTCSEIDQPCAYIRTYSNDQDILGAYYTYIHCFFPVLPPPESHQIHDNPELGTRRAPDAFFSSQKAPNFEPSNPLSLAISASLALIPHPDDPDPTGTDSVHLRREQAQAFAQAAFESIEVESELVDSMTQPSEALSSNANTIERTPFHAQNPLENESIIALLLLSTYEYAQRGNIAKMRNRVGQALNAAINLGLHCRSDEESYYSEANRRVWWMTYIAACQGSILSNSPPPFLLYDPRFTTPGPLFVADPESWTVFLHAQQVIASATQFVIDLDITMKTQSTTATIWQRMLELESLIEPLVLKADTWALESAPPLSLDHSELKVSQALRGMARIKLNSARIKLHRYCAFLDVPVFTKKHCDLASTTIQPYASPTINPPAPSCHCSSSFNDLPTPISLQSSPNSSTSSPAPAPAPTPAPTISGGILPFSSHFSTKVCLRSSFNIARSFQSLPYPQSIRNNDPMAFFMPVSSCPKGPRMVPVFACCAMQSSYAMIMICFKTRAMGFSSEGSVVNSAADRLLGQLSEGLEMVLNALRNYSMAYEALGGMREQIELAADSVKTMKA